MGTCCQSQSNIDGQGQTQISSDGQPIFENITNAETTKQQKQITLNQEKPENSVQITATNIASPTQKSDNKIPKSDSGHQLNSNMPSLNNVTQHPQAKQRRDSNKSIGDKQMRSFPKPFPYEELLSKYEIRQTLSDNGVFSTFLLQNKQISVEKGVLIKCPKNHQDQKYHKQIQMTLSIYSSIDYMNVVGIQGFYEDDNNKYVLQEYLSGDTICKRIKGLDSYSEKVVSGFMRQILGCLVYCHVHNIVHRDIKIGNFLFWNDKLFVLKLIDFQSANLIQPNKKIQEQVGNYMYVAPEILLNKKYDFKCDIWSIGVVLYILLSGVHPFQQQPSQNMEEILMNTVQGKYNMQSESWNGVSNQAKDLVRRMLVIDPDERISASEACAHPWIQQNFQVENLGITQKKLSIFQENTVQMTPEQFQSFLKKL